MDVVQRIGDLRRPRRPNHVVLVEIYRDEAPAAAHKETGHYSGDNRVRPHGEEPFVGGGSQAVADSLPQFVDLAVSLHSRHGKELQRLDGATHRGVWVTSEHFAQRFG
jgi:hypothetical protein